MRDAIAASGKPGVLHSVLAAEVLGLPLDDFLKRLKAKDKTAVDFRQMCKPINFGKGGAMGDAKLVWTSRKKNAGFTLGERGLAVNEKGEPGWWGVRFCILMGNAKVCGERKITEWKRHSCPPVCEACVNAVAGNLTPAYFRRYPEVKTYHNWVQKKLDRHEPAPTAIWSAEEGGPVIIRERMCEDMSAFANNGFQSMLSDISKDAYTTATRECYLGVKDDGSPSPLAGCRLPLMMHDEILSELVADTAHLSGSRIGEIMVASGERMVPGVWRAETALGRYWTKSLEAVYVDGKLAPWEPKQKSS